MSTIDVPNGTIHYEEVGHGRPVVLLHGGVLDLRMWEPQIGPLAATHRVIRFDARGHGKSSTPTNAFRQYDDVAAVLDALELRNATLVGLSMGGGASVDTAIAHPDRIGAVVTVGAGASASYFTDPWMVHLRRAMMDRQLAWDADGWGRLAMKIGLVGPYRRTCEIDPAVVERYVEMMTHTLATHVTPDAVIPDPLSDAWDRLDEIRVPVLTIMGSMDAPDHFAMVERLADGVADAQSRVIQDAGHLPNLERPDEFNAVLLEFLGTLAAQPC